MNRVAFSSPEKSSGSSGPNGGSRPGFQAPSLSLPKGGGALKGIGEKFSFSAQTGTSALSVPFPVLQVRGGLGPTLELAYDSGSGNGIFGAGWQLNIPSISRKTDKGLPKYDDLTASDVFVLSGAEDLVPASADSVKGRDGYLVRRFRPRVESGFARIEWWVHSDARARNHWRVISRENVTHVLGFTADARIADPGDPERIFQWFLQCSFDDKGNALVYQYRAEDLVGIERFDVTLLIGGDAERISSALLDYLDMPVVTLVAPVTEHYSENRPLYLISIPKAGTHLLFRLAQALGYAAGGIAPEQPKGGYWYYLLHSNAHTTAREFFRDELHRAPLGNRAHPFMRSPALFNYRNPLDVLVSEANYWHVDGNSPLSVMLGHLSFEQRVARLVDDRWCLGSIRDRVGEFAAWLDCANVIPVSFEEIVGDAGGGSDAALDALVWSLQLKLHVPGISEDIRAVASNRSSPTFREGRLNGWRQALPAEAIRQIEALPQDFMMTFGYDGSSVLPRHVDAFRRRPLRVMSAAHLTIPYLIEPDFLGHNIVSYRRQYYAIPLSAGAMDLDQTPTESLSKLIVGANLASVRARIVAQEVKRQIEPALRNLVRSGLDELRNRDLDGAPHANEPALSQSNASDRVTGESANPAPPALHGDERVGQFRSLGSFLKFNLFRRRDGVIAVPMRLGPVDPNLYELRFAPGVIASRSLITTRIRILYVWILCRILRLRRERF